MRIKIKVHDKSGMAYFPDELRNEGFTGELEGVPNAYSMLLIKPGASTERVLESLELIKKDIKMRAKYEEQDANEKPKKK